MAELDIGSTITRRRKALDMTQKQLADKLNVTDKAVSKWERGQGYPDITVLNALADALEIPVGELLGGQTADGDEEEAPTDHTLVGTTLRYASRLITRQRTSLLTILKIAFTGLCVVGILTCFIVDMATSGGISWSVYPLAGVLYGWLVGMPLLWFRRHRFTLAMASATLFTLPLLWVIAWRQNGSWFMPIALPCALAGLAFLWLVLLLFTGTRFHLFYKLSILCVLIGLVDLAVDLALAKQLEQNPLRAENIMSLTAALLVAGFFALLGAIFAKRRQNRQD